MNTLPQHILNLIGEFNAEHREIMYSVFCEFVQRERICYNCDEYIEDVCNRKIRKWVGCKTVFCSIVCVINGEYDFFERRYS
jgi:hypothetical protein